MRRETNQPHTNQINYYKRVKWMSFILSIFIYLYFSKNAHNHKKHDALSSSRIIVWSADRECVYEENVWKMMCSFIYF